MPESGPPVAWLLKNTVVAVISDFCHVSSRAARRNVPTYRSETSKACVAVCRSAQTPAIANRLRLVHSKHRQSVIPDLACQDLFTKISISRSEASIVVVVMARPPITVPRGRPRTRTVRRVLRHDRECRILLPEN